MAQPNHTSALSTEQLLKLLEDRANNKEQLNDLDDFEKDALEGFESYSTPENRKALIDSVNKNISLAVQPNETSSKKNRIIWFSAAAGLAFIVVLSVVFMQDATITNTSNIALNEPNIVAPIKEEIIQEAPMGLIETEVKVPEEPAPTEAPKTDLSNKKEIKSKLNLKRNEKISIKASEQAIVVNNSTYAYSTLETYTVGLSSTSQNFNTTVAESNTFKDGLFNSDSKFAESKPSEIPKLYPNITDKKLIEYDKEDNIQLEKEKTNDGDATKKASKTQPSLSINNNSNNATGGSVNSNKESVVNNGTYVVTIASAYYSSGELGIKQFVLEYYKEIKSIEKLKGMFKIKATVSQNGLLQVITIEPKSKDCTPSDFLLKQALNAMKDWKPLIKNGKAVSSEVDFVLLF